jgi:AcrR family transcriptional regulator
MTVAQLTVDYRYNVAGSVSVLVMEAPARPLRADAARNAERIIAAAWAAFTEADTDVPLEEIARRAGVGVATLYRRFATKDDLIIAVVEWRYAEQVEPVLRQAIADPDPWHGMTATLDAALSVAQEELPMIKASRDPTRLIEGIMSRFFVELASVVRRGQENGQIRADLTPADLPPLVYMLIGTIRVTSGDAWRRYVALVLDALRPGAATPLPTATT